MDTPLATTLAGIHDERPPGTVFAAYPGATCTREFIGPGALSITADLVTRVDKAARPVWAAGGLPLVSVKLRPLDVLSGVWDTRLDTLAGWLRDQPPAILVYWHEPENNFTAAKARTFVTAFNHVAARIHAGFADAQIAYCAMGYQWRPGSTTTTDPAIWRAVEADLYLCDVYSGKSFPAATILPEHPGFIRWKQEIIDAVPGRRWGLGERGILASATRAETLRREADWLRTAGAAVYVWWNTVGTEGESGWPILDEARSAESDALRALIAAVGTPLGHVVGPDDTLVCARSGALIARSALAAHMAFMAAIGQPC